MSVHLYYIIHILTDLFSYFKQLCRYPPQYTSIRERTCYNSTCCYYTLFTYMYTRQYYCSSSNPTIITYYYRIFLFSSLKIYRNIQTCKLMTCSHHHYIWPH